MLTLHAYFTEGASNHNLNRKHSTLNLDFHEIFHVIICTIEGSPGVLLETLREYYWRPSGITIGEGEGEVTSVITELMQGYNSWSLLLSGTSPK